MIRFTRTLFTRTLRGALLINYQRFSFVLPLRIPVRYARLYYLMSVLLQNDKAILEKAAEVNALRERFLWLNIRSSLPQLLAKAPVSDEKLVMVKRPFTDTELKLLEQKAKLLEEFNRGLFRELYVVYIEVLLS